MKQDFDILSSGGMIEKTIKPELTYRELDDTDNLYSFLLFTGYLKAISKTDTNTYQLMIPNKEIQYIYTTIFEEWFKQQIRELSGIVSGSTFAGACGRSERNSEYRIISIHELF